ncbi:MAG TPA: hypothetical protein VLX09_12645 [Stellaceae bacterium]|nr:hypothetical protein [Stellaceae bacterium]
MINRIAQNGKEFLRIKRLWKYSHCSQHLHGPNTGVSHSRGAAGYADYWHVRLHSTHDADDLDTIGMGHVEVGNDRVDGLGFQKSVCAQAVLKTKRLVAGALQQRNQVIAEMLVIVDY